MSSVDKFTRKPVKATAALLLLRILPARSQIKGSAPMKAFEKYFNRTRLQCEIIIAESDLKKATVWALRLRNERDVPGYNTRNSRERGYFEAAERMRVLKQKISAIKAELAAMESPEVAA